MQLSLAGWSIQSMFRASPPRMNLVDFPAFAKDTFGLEAVELNNIFFESVRPPYLDQIRVAAEIAGVSLLNIAVDEHGELSSLDAVARAIAVANYIRWVPTAAYLGIKAVRANTGGMTVVNRKAAEKCCVDSFRRLCDAGRQFGVTILVENHWGLSHAPEFIIELVRTVRLTHGDDAIAVLADFGNWPDEIERYTALNAVLPYAAAVHAKINDIDADGTHPRFDLSRCVELVRAAGYDGHLGVEYEGQNVDCIEGVRRGVKTLRRLIGD